MLNWSLYAMPPIAGLVSDLAAIFFLLGLSSKDKFRIPLLSFYFSLANWNLLMLYFVIIPDPEKFTWALYPLHSFHTFIPSTFLFAATILSGRKISPILKASFLGSFAISLFISYLFWIGMGDGKSHITIQKVPWGYYPIAVNWEFAY
jgi:hypothetical protein